MRIGGRVIGVGQPAYVIGEIGANHQGDIEIGKRLIRVAGDASMDCVKFQKRDLDVCIPAHQRDQLRETPWGTLSYYDYRKRLEFNEPAQWHELIDECRMHGLDWCASSWDAPSLDFIDALDPPAHKIASASITDLALMERFGATGRPIIMSTGMSDTLQVVQAVSAIRSGQIAAGVDNPGLALLHCNSSYPCAPQDVNLNAMELLSRVCDAQAWGYCVYPTTKILTTGLRWVKASEIEVGEELIGFDEKLDGNCKMRTSGVLSKEKLKLPCVRIRTERGDVICSTEHLWVASIARGPRGGTWARNHREWTMAKDLKPGDSLAHYIKPWTQEGGFDAGWLSGIFDGEGWVCDRRIAFAQNPGDVLDHAMGLLAYYGFNKSVRKQNKARLCQSVEIGGRRETMRFLGAFRPRRLLAKSRAVWEGVRAWSADSRTRIISVEPVGIQPVIALKTSTKTFIADGFLSHNSGHELGTAISVAAVMRGASIVERHITLDRSMWGTDHAASLEPKQMQQLVRDIRACEAAMGDGRKRVTESELPAMRKLRGGA